jgi:hypothetical protein
LLTWIISLSTWNNQFIINLLNQVPVNLKKIKLMSIFWIMPMSTWKDQVVVNLLNNVPVILKRSSRFQSSESWACQPKKIKSLSTFWSMTIVNLRNQDIVKLLNYVPVNLRSQDIVNLNNFPDNLINWWISPCQICNTAKYFTFSILCYTV